MSAKTINQFFEISQEEMVQRCIDKAQRLPVKLNWGFPINMLLSQNSILKTVEDAETIKAHNLGCGSCIEAAVSIAYLTVIQDLNLPLHTYACGSIKGAISLRNEAALFNSRIAFFKYCSQNCHDSNWHWLFVELYGFWD